MTDKQNRVWRYSYKKWSPGSWLRYLTQIVWPYRGEDEYGFRTLVFHVPGFGFLVWAYKRCRNAECVAYRLEQGLDAPVGEG